MKANIYSVVKYMCYHRWLDWLPDKQYIKLLYRASFSEKLNLENPRTYNEKLQWLKLYDKKEIYKTMVDKVAVRDYIKEQIGDKYLIPVIGIWNSPEEVDFNKLPDKFVLKCNHNSGLGMCICTDKEKLNIEKTVCDLKKGYNENYFMVGREWPYKDLKRKIIAEKYMVDESGDELKDYKVMCFEGEPKLIELHVGRFTDHPTQDFYDTEWNKTDISQGNEEGYGISDFVIPKPKCLEEMLLLSRKLSKGIHHLRVDWYSINGKLYFGELTFFDGSGFVPYDNPEYDLMLGSWIKIS